MTTPAQMALEYRIWAHCDPLGWNVTPGEIAAELGVGLQYVNHALRRRGWANRVRGSATQRGVSYGQAANRTAGLAIADDVAHGRINMSVD